MKTRTKQVANKKVARRTAPRPGPRAAKKAAAARPVAVKAKKGSAVEEKSRTEIEALAEKEAQEIFGVIREEAFQKLDRGELRGTVAEAEFRSLKRLLDA